MGKVAYQVTRAAGRAPNIKVLQALERNSETLDRVGDAFRQTILKQTYQLCSFWEEKEIRKFVILGTIVVEADSAKIGDGREEVNRIPASHSEMSKFSSSSDIGFKRVSNVLLRWVQEITTSGTRM